MVLDFLLFFLLLMADIQVYIYIHVKVRVFFGSPNEGKNLFTQISYEKDINHA